MNPRLVEAALRLSQSRVAAAADGIRRLGRAAPLVLYYQPGDPYSLLCMQWLRKIRSRLAVPLEIRAVPPPVDEAFPEREKQRAYALRDAGLMAPAWGLELPWSTLPSEPAERAAAETLAGVEDAESFLVTEQSVQQSLWSGAAPAGNGRPSNALLEHAAERTRRGHYLGGMWFFAGQWYWALDRVAHLEAALRRVDGVIGEAALLVPDLQRLRLPAQAPSAIDFYFSFRSPYSYLTLPRLQALATKGLPLRIRPVLPMVMRGLPIPPAKRFYIVSDCFREARRLGIAFGRIRDPVGEGARRSLALFPHEAPVETQLAYLLATAEATWAEGRDLCEDATLRAICERAGCAFDPLILTAPDALAYAEANRQALFDAGGWGVPSFAGSGLLLWGQDRVAVLEEWLHRAPKSTLEAASP